jgi:ectoine hydroxylase-related dioxygenase (phytanoyl-CoA dioxygenase family)
MHFGQVQQQQPSLSSRECGKRISEVRCPETEGKLYIGNAAVAKDEVFLTSFGFAAVLSVGGGRSGSKHGFEFMHVGVKDSSDDSLFPHFIKCCDFIKKHLDAGARVLVHCRGGVHRSPSIVAAFLVREFGTSVEKAVQIVTASRSSARFTQHHTEQLHLLNRQCVDHSSSTPGASSSNEGSTCRLVDLSYLTVERDREDERFVMSFSVHDDAAAAKQFFDKFGFIVFRNVLTADECKKTRQEMWETIEMENPTLSRKDASTWAQWNSNFGMPKAKVIFSPQICKNRCNPNIHTAFSTVMGTRHLMLSHDRFTIYRPTKRCVDGPQFSTRTNLHLDIDPWRFLANDSDIESLRYTALQDFIRENNSVINATGPHVQAVLNLRDNFEEDGGTQVIPGFHKVFEEWASDEQTSKQNKTDKTDKIGGSFKLNPKHYLSQLGQRLPMREGSILLWDQRVMHGSVANRSNRLRMAQFMKGFPVCSVSDARQKNRSEALQQHFRVAGLAEWADCLGPQETEMLGL